MFKSEKHTPIDGDYWLIFNDANCMVAKTFTEIETEMLVNALNMYESHVNNAEVKP